VGSRRGTASKTFALSVAAVVVAAACGELAALTDPPRLQPEHLKPQLTPQTSTIYARGGRTITQLHAEKDRTVVPLNEVPRHARQAIVAVEDQRFYEHEGVDLIGITRAAVANIERGGVVEGGSTITQQLVKNTIIAPDGERASLSLERKIEEAALSRQLEKELTKDEILERYLNTVYFGNGAYGIEAAARAYFAKSAVEMNHRQSALLAGLIRAPQHYDPFEHRKRARERRNLVLRRMADLAVQFLKDLGADAVIVETKGHPVVSGGWRHDPAAPTLTIYNHLDGQPAQEP
jgi:penicillin-binding protein 1A